MEVTTKKETIFGDVGLRFRGHQFRYSYLELDKSDSVEFAYNFRKRKGDQVSEEGYSKNSVLASYIHAHWASNPSLAEGFVRSCLRK